jgi:hypothetical protein
MMKTLCNREIAHPQELIDKITWSIDSQCDQLHIVKIKQAFLSFITGNGVPPLASYLVTPDEYIAAYQDPCYRTKRLLMACRGSSTRPIGNDDSWIKVSFV